MSDWVILFFMTPIRVWLHKNMVPLARSHLDSCQPDIISHVSKCIATVCVSYAVMNQEMQLSSSGPSSLHDQR